MTKAKTTRLAPGLYRTAAGHTIERVPQELRWGWGPFAWYVTWPGETKPDAVFYSKREALENLEGEL